MPSALIPRPGIRPALTLAVLLQLLAPRPGRAETVVAYKYQDYQEAGGRISVHAQYGLVEQTLGTEAKLKITGVIDAISGATPTGEPADPATGRVPLTQLHDRRKAWTADFSRQFGRTNVAVGAANSRESDYVSTAYTLNTLTDFNGKNTTLLAGISTTDDDVKVFYQAPRAGKRSLDLIVGVTQLLDEKTTLVLNASYGSASGYLSDPYKIIRKNTELLPGIFLPLTFAENRPDEREKWIAFASINHAVTEWKGAVEASYRLYHDTFGVTSHTLAATWLQRLGEEVVLAPSVRFYRQSAADFYRLSLDGTSITPGTMPNPAGPFFSADYRLAEFDSWTWGVKLVWTPKPAFQADLAWEAYEMNGRDGMTSASAFPRAKMLTAGVRFAW
jgi:hypothetical protein